MKVLTRKTDLASYETFVALPLEKGEWWICLFLICEIAFSLKKVVEFLGHSESPSLKLVKLHTRIRYVTGVNQNFHKLPSEVY